jgi:hypothetical protein
MEIAQIEPVSNQSMDDLEEYFELRKKEITSSDFGEKCRIGLEKNRGPVPTLTIPKH